MGSEILNNGLCTLIFMSRVRDIAVIVENELLLVGAMKKAEGSFEALWDSDEDSAWDDV